MLALLSNSDGDVTESAVHRPEERDLGGRPDHERQV